MVVAYVEAGHVKVDHETFSNETALTLASALGHTGLIKLLVCTGLLERRV